MLNPDDLNVETFPMTSAAIIGPGGGFCCTGCTSGCGINPTALGCESGGDKTTIIVLQPADRTLIAE